MPKRRAMPVRAHGVADRAEGLAQHTAVIDGVFDAATGAEASWRRTHDGPVMRPHRPEWLAPPRDPSPGPRS